MQFGFALEGPAAIAVIAVYGIMSCITFFAYGWDKWRSGRGQARVREKTLHVLELLGGWPGAWFGMWAFRHKTAKPGFRVISFAIAMLHVAVWTALSFWTAGRA